MPTGGVEAGHAQAGAGRDPGAQGEARGDVGAAGELTALPDARAANRASPRHPPESWQNLENLHHPMLPNHADFPASRELNVTWYKSHQNCIW